MILLHHPWHSLVAAKYRWYCPASQFGFPGGYANVRAEQFPVGRWHPAQTAIGIDLTTAQGLHSLRVNVKLWGPRVPNLELSGGAISKTRKAATAGAARKAAALKVLTRQLPDVWSER